MKSALIIGDSLVQGVGAAGRGWAAWLADKMPHIDTVVAGVGGDTAEKVLGRWPDRRFDLVILQVGTNDSCTRAYKNDFESPPPLFLKSIAKIDKRVQADGGVLVIVGVFVVDEARTNPFNADKSYTNVDLKRYDKVLAAFARRHHRLYVPLRSSDITPGMLHPDGLHPSDEGHAYIGRRVSRAIKGLIRPPAETPEEQRLSLFTKISS